MRILLCTLVLLLAFPIAAVDVKTIQLEDGSSLKGEVVSLRNGIYTFRTSSLGMIQLKASKVKSIRSGSGNERGSSGIFDSFNLDTAEFDAIKQMMMSNVDVMAAILDLHNDPQLQAVLSDPEIMQAVRNLDIEALTNNRKFKALLGHPKIKLIQEQARP